MAANTEWLDGDYTMFSSISLMGSRATLKCKNLVIDGTSSYSVQLMEVGDGTALAPSHTFISDRSLGLYRSRASQIAMSYGQFLAGPGSAVAPGVAFSSESSLGFYRSAASTLALSYGQAKVPDGSAILPPVCYSSESSLGLFRSAASTLALSYGQFQVQDGTAVLPPVRYASEASLGLYRSAASNLALSYGHLNAQYKVSTGTLAASCTTTNVVDKEIKFSILSLTSNGAQFGFRSGNTTWIWNSDLAG